MPGPFAQWIRDRALTLWEAAERADKAYTAPRMRAGAAAVARAYREAAAVLERHATELDTTIASTADTGVFAISDVEEEPK